MRVIAFVGSSGTGKSYRSVTVSDRYGADGIIDDGLLISHGKVIAGTSAKKEHTKIASVKHALFMEQWHANEVKKALVDYNIQCLMILGTSDRMVEKIAARLGLPKVEQYIRIEDVATPKEMEMAHNMRVNQGKHVIPVPTFEIKKDFSGYFLHPLRRFQKNLDTEIDTADADKSIVRPTFSYMGDYTISDNVIESIAVYEAERIENVGKVQHINIRKTKHGVHIDMTVTLIYGCNIYDTCREIQLAVRDNVEKYTSINARRVHIFVRNLI
ncbi:MAG: Asp23/Gls24 family envelope stress response protein [Oscillospiraceae bacterium]|nr:Asp23/Gls24 family envelope stress response protein [Oscillospiraceae bacterium]